MKALFQIDELSSLNKKTDTSLAIIKEGISLGNEIWITNPDKLTFFNNKASLFARKVIGKKLDLSDEHPYFLDYFNFFFIRQDPPFDMNYISNCYLLELHNNLNNKPFFINSPSGIKNFTEKIFPLYFYNLMPSTMVTSTESSFISMLNKFQTVIIKPLYCKGGEGIFKINLGDDCISKFKYVLDKYKAPLVVQEYLENVKHGDKRVLFINGSVAGVINRVPKSGEFKANLHLGGEARKIELTKKEKEICNILGPVFTSNNLFLVGIDLIDEKLTEINVTSPTGLTQVDELYGTRLKKKIWEELEGLIEL